MVYDVSRGHETECQIYCHFLARQPLFTVHHYCPLSILLSACCDTPFYQPTRRPSSATMTKVATTVLLLSIVASASAFSASSPQGSRVGSALRMGLFDGWVGSGTGANKENLDEQWERQQEILRNRRDPSAKKAYFDRVNKDRADATRKQDDMWGWQTKKYKKGEDPIDEWRKRRADGTIADIEDQYGDPKKIGGIPLPGASFGVGGEFGVG